MKHKILRPIMFALLGSLLTIGFLLLKDSVRIESRAPQQPNSLQQMLRVVCYDVNINK